MDEAYSLRKLLQEGVAAGRSYDDLMNDPAIMAAGHAAVAAYGLEATNLTEAIASEMAGDVVTEIRNDPVYKLALANFMANWGRKPREEDAVLYDLVEFSIAMALTYVKAHQA